MKLPEKRTLLLLATFLLAITIAESQSVTERRFLSASTSSAFEHINETQLAIYSGPLYQQYFIQKGNDGNPFFENTKPEAIMYDGIVYHSVNFIYDIFKDEIIVVNPDDKWLVPHNAKIAYFILGGRKLQRLQDIPGLKNGFYELVAERNGLKLVTKWTKVFQASVWKQKVFFYTIKDVAKPIRNKKDLLALFPGRAAEVNQFIRQNRLRFNAKNKLQSFKKVIESV